MADSNKAAVAKAGIVTGIFLWLVGAIYAGVNGAVNVIDVVWLTGWIVLPIAVGVHASLSEPDRPVLVVGMALASAIPFLGILPATYYLGYTTYGD